MNRIAAGAIAGFVATIPMTATMYCLHRHLPKSQRYPLPPREITQAALHKTGTKGRLSSRQIGRLSLLAHFAYGAGTGAIYAACSRNGSPVTCGALYGLGVWAISYLGWIPAAGLLKPATEHPRRRNALMLLAHLVWGGATGWLSKSLSHANAEASDGA